MSGYSSKEIVFDIETYGDIKNLASLKVTVVSIYDYETDSYRSFIEDELFDLWSFLEKAERLIGFNSESFDVPILNRYYAGDLTTIPQLDLLKIIKESSGKRFKLADLAKATLDITKSADGLQALKWYEEGKINEIKMYCEQDVKVTKELYEFGRKNRMLYYPTLTGELVPIAVNFEPMTQVMGKEQVASGINMTLPF